MPSTDNLSYKTSAAVTELGRYCDLEGIKEVQDLEYGMDFRRPEYRREVFLRFYEEHLRLRAHPGCIYFLMPFLYKKYKWTTEQRLWYAFINGNTQNPVTSKLIFDRFPDYTSLSGISTWFNENYAKLVFDQDRRHHKKSFIKAIESYRECCGVDQGSYFGDLTDSTDEGHNFRNVWQEVSRRFYSFGRLTTFSYLEYLRVMKLRLDCDQLFLEDMSGSKSHRNGLSKVLGRDDWDWHQSNQSFTGKYTPLMLSFLKNEGEILLEEAKARFKGEDFYRDVSYFTLESTFCTFKSWFRPNRRYAGVYLDMLFDRINKVQELWPDEDLSDFWEARKQYIPSHYLRENNPNDPGVKGVKQNHFRNTGQVIMLDYRWPCFQNSFETYRSASVPNPAQDNSVPDQE
jgi:hypothetical protein